MVSLEARARDKRREIRLARLDELHAEASRLLSLGEWTAAEALGSQAVEGRSAVLGGRHPRTLQSRLLIGKAKLFQRKHKEAAQELGEVAMEQRRADEYADLSETDHWLGRTLYYLGRYQEAVVLLTRASKGESKRSSAQSGKWLGLARGKAERKERRSSPARGNE